MSELLVRDAELLVTMTGAEIAGGWVAISGGMVDAVGGPGTEPGATETLSARGCLVTPGLINTHHHMFQNLTRAYGPGLKRELLDWAGLLGDMWIRMDEEAAYVSAWVGLAELALGGCTQTTDDLYTHPRPKLIDAEIAAARDLGMRFDPCRGCIAVTREQGAVFRDELVQDRDEILADTERLIAAYHDRSPGAMVRIVAGPTAGDTAAPGQMEASAELAEKHDVRMTTHLSQFPGEEAWSLAKFGMKPIDWFESVGWAGPRAWVAHCIFVDDGEIARLAEWGTGVAHCPSTCCLISEGSPPVATMRAAGVNVGLAVDGAGSEHASLWLEAHTALLLGRLRTGPTTTSARDVLEMATLGSARCLGREAHNGFLAPGACGDLVAWPLEGIRFAGAWSDPVEAWLRCGPVAPRHTVVAGRPVVRDSELAVPGLDEMLKRHAAISREWQDAAE